MGWQDTAKRVGQKFSCLVLLLFMGLFMSLVTVKPTHASGVGESNPGVVEAVITLEKTTARYVGKINEDNVARFLSLVDGKGITELTITSSGGEIFAGMKMGEWVYANQIDVVVESMCMSSCANYVFPAGRHKTINQGALVAWHGSITHESSYSDDDVRTAVLEGYAALPEEVRAQVNLEDLIKQSIGQANDYRALARSKQAEFYERIGVDEYVTRIGIEEYGAENFFLLSVEDMARFGILEVTAPDGYEETDLTPYRTLHSIDFIHLK